MMEHIPMRFRKLLFAAVTTIAAAFPASNADEWVRLTTPHFEIYTTAGEKKGRDAILYFEQVRSFVTEITHANRDQPVPVRIIAFKSEKQFRPYATNGAGAAYYASTQESRLHRDGKISMPSTSLSRSTSTCIWWCGIPE